MVTNLAKNSASASALDRTNRYSFLLLENGSYLLQESYGKIILSDGRASFSNMTKNAGVISNLSKS